MSALRVPEKTAKRGRPKGKRYGAMLAVRLPEGLLEKLDAYVDKLREQEPAYNLTRTDAVRRILMKALIDEKP